MKVRGELRAFGEGGAVREIELPDREWIGLGQAELLELAFTYGQNDRQPQEGLRSISVGDVLELPRVTGCGSRWFVESHGFRRDRSLYTRLRETEREIVLEALAEHGFRRLETARALGISREWLWKLCLRHGLEPAWRCAKGGA